MADSDPGEGERWIEPDRRAITDPVLDFFAKSESSMTRVRALAEAGAELDRAQWRELCASGHFLPDGRHRTLSQSAVVAQEWGRALGQGPFVESSIVELALSQSPSHPAKVLPEIAAGRQLATWASSRLPGFWGPGPGVQVAPSPAGFVLDGDLGLVLDAAVADWILLSARQLQDDAQNWTGKG